MRELTQNPKTGPKETRVIVGRTVLGRRRDDAKKAHTEEQIVAVLQQGQAGEKVADICRKVGISEGTYYAWKKQFAGLGITELRELRQLREENGRLKRLVADLSLDRQILQEIVSKKL
jgi:putative transposase